MQQPRTILEEGTRIRTEQKIGTTNGMVAMPSLTNNRRVDALGRIRGILPGHGGDVYWVTHDDGTVAPYAYEEFNLVV